MGVGYAGVEPVKTCLIDFRVRVIDQERFGEYPFAIGTAMIEQIKRTVATILWRVGN